MRAMYKSRSIALFVRTSVLLAFASLSRGQGLGPTTPAVIYVRFGGELVALEYPVNSPIGGSSAKQAIAHADPPNFLVGSPFQPWTADETGLLTRLREMNAFPRPDREKHPLPVSDSEHGGR